MNTLRVAAFLAVRYVTRNSWWQTALVVFVMTLTFLNLVVVTGILTGLINGSLLGYSRNYAGDLIISKLPEKELIERAGAIQAALEKDPGVYAYSARTMEPGQVEAGYLRAVSAPNQLPDRISTSIAGIDLVHEDKVTNLSARVIEGTFLEPGDDDAVVLGANLVERYFPAPIKLQTLADVYVGDKVLITIGTQKREFFVKGIVKTKTDATDQNVFMLNSTLKGLSANYGSLAVDEFAVKLMPGATVEDVRARLLGYGFGHYALIRTAEEAIGEFIDEIRSTMTILGNVIGAISVVVASVTIFIIIFITAITRQKYIGILKAIGINALTIELSYVMLSVFYALFGITVGVVVLYAGLVPYFAANPINFPFSDGVLSVTTVGVSLRAMILMVTTIIAGYIPARMIVQRNTLDAILGR